MTDTGRKLLYLLGAGTGGRWLLVIGLALLVGILEALAGVLVFVLLGLVTGSEGALELPVLGDVSRWFPNVEQSQLLLGAAGAIAVFFIGRGAVVIAQSYLEHRVSENAGARLADRVARGYLSMPYAYHLQRNSAELIRNTYDSVQELVSRVFVRGIRLIAEVVIVAGLLIVMIVMAPVATLLAVLVLGPLVIVLLKVVQPRFGRIGTDRQAFAKDSLQALQEGLQGMREIKVLGRERFFADRFARSRAQLAQSQYRFGTLVNIPFVVTETALILAIVGFFLVAVATGRGALDAVPILGLFAYAGLRIKPSLTAIVSSLNSVRYAGAAIDHIYEDLRRCEEAVAAAEQDEVEPVPFQEALTVEDVSFRYESADDDALKDVNLTLPKNSSLGIVGPTGGGKSTLVDLMIGLLEPTSGRIAVDGVDLRGRERGWQANIGVVPQSIFLVDDTVRRNIAFGLKDDEIDEDAVLEAVELAQLDDVVAGLPHGLDTRLGERGIRLSGGQRQRVAIARALYRRPEVLVFDEGTSALDTATERQIIASLDRLRDNRTLITVAHRLSTVRDCDAIAVVSDGRIVDTGTFDELADRSSEFRELAR